MRFVAAILVAVAGCVQPEEPAPPGSGGKADEAGALRERLHAQVTARHVALSYFDAREAMFGITSKFDLVDGALECIYTGRRVAPDGTHTAGGFNTEHVWPQSQGAQDEPPRSDLHHLFPVDAQANTARASHAFGDTSCGEANQMACAWQAGGSSLESLAADAVFEVRPERRGDVARAKFYFAVRYELAIPADEEAALRAWHAEDPPDDRERARNAAIDELQHNHNPFVDQAELVDDLDDF